MDVLYIDATSGGLLLQLLLGGAGGAAAVLKIVFGRRKAANPTDDGVALSEKESPSSDADPA